MYVNEKGAIKKQRYPAMGLKQCRLFYETTFDFAHKQYSKFQLPDITIQQVATPRYKQ